MIDKKKLAALIVAVLILVPITIQAGQEAYVAIPFDVTTRTLSYRAGMTQTLPFAPGNTTLRAFGNGTWGEDGNSDSRAYGAAGGLIWQLRVLELPWDVFLVIGGDQDWLKTGGDDVETMDKLFRGRAGLGVQYVLDKQNPDKSLYLSIQGKGWKNEKSAIEVNLAITFGL